QLSAYSRSPQLPQTSYAAAGEGSGNMLIIAIMAVGIWIGYQFFPERLSKVNSGVQTVCTAVLIFIMGVSLGNRPNFLQELRSIGWDSLVFSLVPIAASVVLV